MNRFFQSFRFYGRENTNIWNRIERRFAVLIDADNVSPKYIKYILDEVSDQGIATYKRIYGDWTDNEKRSWKNVLLDWSGEPHPAVQLHHRQERHGFRHDHRRHGHSVLREMWTASAWYPATPTSPSWPSACSEAGMFVMGIGEQKTPKPFQRRL